MQLFQLTHLQHSKLNRVKATNGNRTEGKTVGENLHLQRILK